MKYKSIFLLLIFSCSFIPFNPVQAEEQITRSIYDAHALLYLSEAILLDEDLDENTITAELHSPVFPSRSMDIRGRLIDQMINATKKQRNDLDQKCRETAEIYRQQGKTCEADQTEAYCKQRKAELTDKISLLREVRGGDNRSPFTKAWHGLKRTGAKFWHRIGPLGRKFLREVGPEALKIITTGGPGAETLMKNLFKHTVKNIGRQQVKQIGLRALQRLLKVQFEVATAAGIDICNPEEEVSEETETDELEELTTEEKNEFSLGVFIIEDTFDEAFASMEWDGFVPAPDGFGTKWHQAYADSAIFNFEIDLDEGTFTGSAAGDAYATELGWEAWGVFAVEGITGSVTENPNGSGYIFNGTGTVTLQYRMEAYLNDSTGNSVLVTNEDSAGGPVIVEGRLYVDYDTWVWSPSIHFTEGPKRFRLTCANCELWPWEP